MNNVIYTIINEICGSHEGKWEDKPHHENYTNYYHIPVFCKKCGLRWLPRSGSGKGQSDFLGHGKLNEDSLIIGFVDLFKKLNE